MWTLCAHHQVRESIKAGCIRSFNLQASPPKHAHKLLAKVQHQKQQARRRAAVAELPLMEERGVKGKHKSEPRARILRACGLKLRSLCFTDHIMACRGFRCSKAAARQRIIEAIRGYRQQELHMQGWCRCSCSVGVSIFPEQADGKTSQATGIILV